MSRNAKRPNELALALLRLSRAFFALAVRSLPEGADITLAQFRALVLLDETPNIRMVNLADLLGVSPSTATRLCDRLATRGLVDRRPSLADRREVWLSLTADGRAVVEDAMGRRGEAIVESLRHVSPDDAATMLQGVELAIRVFEDFEAPAMAQMSEGRRGDD